MPKILYEQHVCQCCAMWLANRDATACANECRFDHAFTLAALLPAARTAVTNDGLDEEVWTEWTCQGCDTPMLPGDVQRTAVVMDR